MSVSRTRTMMTAAAALAALTALAGCTAASDSDAGADEGTALAGIIANSTDPFWISVMCGASKEAEAQSVQMTWYTSPTTSAESMSQNFTSATLADPDGVFLNPFQATQFSTQVADLMAKGVPVITSVPLDPATQYTDIPLATDGANYIDQFLDMIPEGPGAMVALGGITGIPPLDATWMPIEAAVAEARPDIRILPTEYTDFDVTKTNQIVSALLLANPDLNVILASTGPEGAGAAAAVEQAGLAGKVMIWAYDAIPAQVAALEAGVITVLAAKPAEAMGAAAVTELLAAIEANPDRAALQPRTALEPLPMTIITKENLNTSEAQAALYRESCS